MNADEEDDDDRSVLSDLSNSSFASGNDFSGLDRHLDELDFMEDAMHDVPQRFGEFYQNSIDDNDEGKENFFSSSVRTSLVHSLVFSLNNKTG